jgi:hypothetical protein
VTVRDPTHRCRLVGLPSALSQADYAEAGAELEEALAALPEVISVYATGGVTNPGISDLDSVAVATAPVSADVWRRLSPRTRAVAMHSPFLVDHATFEGHRWFARLEPLTLVFGEAIGVDEPGEPALLGRVLAAEGIVVALLNVHKQLGTGRIKVRSTLCMLHSLRHSLELGGIGAGDAADAWRLVEDVADLRESWFLIEAGEREQRTRVAIAKALDALPQAISRLSPPRGEGDARPGSALRLAPPWTAFTLVRADPERTAPSSPRPTPPPFNRMRRLSEAYWRMRRIDLKLTPPAFDLLALERHPDGCETLQRRCAIVRAYREYLGASTGQWSALGFAHTFAPE